MERYRNFVRLEQMKENIRSGRQTDALEIAEMLDIKKIRNNSDINLMADLYLENGMYEKAYEALREIHARKPGRTVLMQLINLTLTLKDTKAAERFYAEFHELAPGDYYNHIYRYNIDKLEKKGLDVLIADLETLKKEEYIDVWAYELAKLYHKSGLGAKCVKECKDIETWFGDGEYVERAKALRAYYRGELDLGEEESAKKTANEKEVSEKAGEFEDSDETEGDESTETSVINEDPEDGVSLRDDEESEGSADEPKSGDNENGDLEGTGDFAENEDDQESGDFGKVEDDQETADFSELDNKEENKGTGDPEKIEKEAGKGRKTDSEEDSGETPVGSISGIDEQFMEMSVADVIAGSRIPYSPSKAKQRLEGELLRAGVESSSPDKRKEEIPDEDKEAVREPAEEATNEPAAEPAGEHEADAEPAGEHEADAEPAGELGEISVGEPGEVSDTETADEPAEESVSESEAADDFAEEIRDFDEAIAVETVDLNLKGGLPEGDEAVINGMIEQGMTDLAMEVNAELEKEHADEERWKKTRREYREKKDKPEVKTGQPEKKSIELAQYEPEKRPIDKGSLLGQFLNKRGEQPENYFGFLAAHPTVGSQLVKNLEILLNPQIKNKCLVVTGVDDKELDIVIKGTAKVMYNSGYLEHKQIFNSKAEKLDASDLENKVDKLIGSCFVIRQAGDLKTETAAKLLAVSKRLLGHTVVVLADEKSRMNGLFRDNRELTGMFPQRIHIPDPEVRDIIDFMLYTIHAEGYLLEKEAGAETEKAARKICNRDNVVTLAEKLVLSAIDKVETRNAKTFMKRENSSGSFMSSNVLMKNDIETAEKELEI